MRSMNFREWLMLCCAGLLFAACIVTFVRYGTYQALIRQRGWDNAWTRTIFADNPGLQHWTPPRNARPDEVPMDWAAKYPFRTAPTVPAKPENTFQKTSGRFRHQTEQFALWTNHQFPFYQRFVEMMQACRQTIGWNISTYSDESSATQLPDGHWTGFQLRTDVSKAAASTDDFAAFCRKRGIHFLFILAPSKVARSDPYAETLDSSNANGDAFLHRLDAYDIRSFDLRTFFKQSDEDLHNSFFKSDHHWKPEAARLAAQKIDCILNDDFGYHADPVLLDPNNYDEVCYPARHLGAFGQHATPMRAVPDDISLFYPKFPTSFHLDIPSMQIDTDGDFSIFYDTKMLDISNGYYSSYVYATYLYGDRALISIHNQKKSDGRKLLLVRDSFSDAMAPFLSLGMEQLRTIDLRYFSGSLRTYIEQERPDTVAICYTSSVFAWDHIYPRSVFDFR